MSERGYAGNNTNVVAEVAGVSVGSVYQYFPNKDSLIAALHERHALQMNQAMESSLADTQSLGLRGRLSDLVKAWLAAHRVDPELHRVLEKDFPFFDAPASESQADQSIRDRIRQLLEEHRSEVAPQDLDLATWVVMQSLESLIHGAIIPPVCRIHRSRWKRPLWTCCVDIWAVRAVGMGVKGAELSSRFSSEFWLT
ncbi:putative TetR family regulator [Alcaligenes sp. HPC1271]|nr:TetR/AcrR family transcriptional regulator [Alcaligenes sp. HPC1271]EKU31105.1 putative TetR family regulator [Alcaligenes sp. HPC1271]